LQRQVSHTGSKWHDSELYSQAYTSEQSSFDILIKKKKLDEIHGWIIQSKVNDKHLSI